jgi:simple sugar transport system ATP-binding protein
MNYELYNKKKIVRWKTVNEIAKEALDHIGIEMPLNAKVGDLSVADKQLIAIARSILYNSRLVIMDEPTKGIDVGAKKEIYEIILTHLKGQFLPKVLLDTTINLKDIIQYI